MRYHESQENRTKKRIGPKKKTAEEKLETPGKRKKIEDDCSIR